MLCEHEHLENGRCWSQGCNYCTHKIKFNGICVACDYIDEKEFSEAKNLEKQNSDKLLKAKKLSLIIDLDKTILHATSVYDVVEWIEKQKRLQNKSSTKDIITILNDRYAIKLRPGLHRFLKHMSRLYELHVYTMGRKSYAKAILDKIDPYRTLFQGQILTRDSNGSMNKKRLDRIFPSDTSTVLILDDCTEVWNGCPNLIHIKPYEYFIGVDEVNCVPSLNKFRLSSAKRSFLRLSNSALSQSFMKENEDDEDEDEIERNGDENDVKDQIISVESDSNDDTVVNSSGEETRYEASTLETVQDFSFDYVSSDAYKNDAFSIPSGLRKNEKENSDSFDSYFDQCIADIIPSQPEQDDILDSTRKILAYIHHVYFKELSAKLKKPNVVDILNTLKYKSSGSSSPIKEERSAKYNHNLRKRTHSELELESVSFKRVKSEVY